MIKCCRRVVDQTAPNTFSLPSFLPFFPFIPSLHPYYILSLPSHSPPSNPPLRSLSICYLFFLSSFVLFSPLLFSYFIIFHLSPFLHLSSTCCHLYSLSSYLSLISLLSRLFLPSFPSYLPSSFLSLSFHPPSLPFLSPIHSVMSYLFSSSSSSHPILFFFHLPSYINVIPSPPLFALLCSILFTPFSSPPYTLSSALLVTLRSLCPLPLLLPFLSSLLPFLIHSCFVSFLSFPPFQVSPFLSLPSLYLLRFFPLPLTLPSLLFPPSLHVLFLPPRTSLSSPSCFTLFLPFPPLNSFPSSPFSLHSRSLEREKSAHFREFPGRPFNNSGKRAKVNLIFFAPFFPLFAPFHVTG